MLLRRVIEHVKTQNWTAVALDFVIVVVGVFIGIQVANWNEARTEIDLENKYLVRLHHEIIEAESGVAVISELKALVQESFNGVVDALRSDSEGAMLTGKECASIYFSHIYDEAFPSLPTMTELLASGRLSVLRSDDLRAALAKHEQALRSAEEFRDGYQMDRVVMTSEHADLVQLSVSFFDFSVSEPDFVKGISDEMIKCDVEGMRSNAKFRNDFIDNASRHTEYFLAIDVQKSLLAEIHTEIDKLLLIRHDG